MYACGNLKLDIVVSQSKRQTNGNPAKFLQKKARSYVNCAHKMSVSPKQERIPGHGIFFTAVQNKIRNVKIGKVSFLDPELNSLFHLTVI